MSGIFEFMNIKLSLFLMPSVNRLNACSSVISSNSSIILMSISDIDLRFAVFALLDALKPLVNISLFEVALSFNSWVLKSNIVSKYPFVFSFISMYRFFISLSIESLIEVFSSLRTTTLFFSVIALMVTNLLPS